MLCDLWLMCDILWQCNHNIMLNPNPKFPKKKIEMRKEKKYLESIVLNSDI